MQSLADAAHNQVGTESRGALWARGVSDEQIDSFAIGVLPGSTLPAGIECDPRFVSWWGAHRRHFKNPLVFPLTTSLGVVQGLQFRDREQRVRGYLDYFESKEEPALFGLSHAMPSVWETECAWVVEGVFDLCPVQRHIPNVISTLHAGVSGPLRRLLHRIARKLVVAYDMDSTGRKVAYDLVRELKDEFEVKVLGFPRVSMASGHVTKDPNELWSVWGDQALGAFIKRWCA
jgi:DNA primase